LIRPGASQNRPNFIERWRKILDGVRELWPLIWPGRHEDLQHCAVLCGFIFVFQRLLYILVPYLLGRLVEVTEENGDVWVLLPLFFACKLAKDHLCKELQSLLWRKIAYQTEQIVSLRALRHIFRLPEHYDTWASGAFLSDFNKGGLLNTCLEEILFSLVPVILDLLATTIYVWMLLGTGYGCLICVMSLWYIHFVIRTVQISIL
jgi:ABC-type bacteriocin/lantibiotic exporter with double-glycine peptidase domain